MQKKLFLTYVVLIVFLSTVIGLYSVNICQSYYINDYKEHLVKESKILSSFLSEEYYSASSEKLEEFITRYSKSVETRITLIDKNGTVLCDSQANEKELENHKNRAEIRSALNGTIEVRSRYSQTLKTDYIYVAVPVEGTVAVLRLAVPLLELIDIKNQVMITVFIGIFSAACISFLFTYFVSKKISSPLDKLTEAAEEISRGNLGRVIAVEGKDQIARLTKTFNRMSSQLNTTIYQLEYENMKLESIVNSMINGVIAVDTENKILMINSVCYQLFNIKINDIIGYNFYDVIRNEDVYEVLDKSIKGKEHIVKEFLFCSLTEGDKILRVYANPISAQVIDSNVKGSLLVFQDITQIRKLEQLRSDFVSNVTHELKTPLTSIMGFTDTLKAGAIHDKKAALHFLEIIEIETKRLYRLILDILSLSEIETRQEDINMQKEDINLIIQEVCRVLEPQAKEKGITMNTKIEKNAVYFECNRDRISQMLMNLIDNAIKYTEKGKIDIVCCNHKKEIEISICDTGIGIPKENIERIFERFYRVDKGRSRKAGGTGLGLSIVKHIVMLYEGKLTVTSEEGKGTQFTIKLPYKVKQYYNLPIS